MNRPRRLNALDMEMVDIIYPHLKAWEVDETAKIILMKGRGRAFCAGGDVKDVISMIKDPAMQSKLNHQLDTEYDMVHFIGTMKTPYIAVMDGITMGAGGGLACHAPFRIATENTQFAMPETAIGLFCDVGASFFLSRLDGYLGRYMALTSKILKAEDALFSGIATHFVFSDRLEELESKLDALQSPQLDEIDELIGKYSVSKNHEPTVYTLYGQNRVIIDKCFKYDTVEQIIDALNEDGSQFALQTVDTILKRSPTSLKVTLEHLRRGINLSLKNCLRMEHVLWQTVPYSHDFVEGVTSHVIHKRTPDWKPKKLEDLDLDSDIKVKYFHANVKRKLIFTNEQDDYIEHPYQRYALPTARDILQAYHAEKYKSAEEAVSFFTKERGDKFGLRQKIEDVFAREVQSIRDG
ncbi:ClpP/crotonase-like domain-containing protein [Mycotypha africana]|uniref:ClpP/crotonase-like domain-containing protein n=1 Tax=Mycotypha africana TaxID=64632 RepID=UPI002301306B|nr:ClpP/crotonase-like domain-containing protein [Mycotypha africana]KAI8970052.1 ClpP/crotonase-like domain-containing protein [Mycotypha africana]